MNQKRGFISIVFAVIAVALIIGVCLVKANRKSTTDEVMVGQYDLGDIIFEENGVEITSPIRGAIGVPKEDNSPIVFILHGSHLIEGDVKRPYAEGFEYLVEHLAEQGYLAISINVNRAYMFEPVEGNELDRMNIIFEENYNRVKSAIEGKNLYPFSLKGKGDLSKINMIGHSRGGENIFNIIESNKFKNISFVSAISVAPSRNTNFCYTYTDIPTAVIIPQFDTDVSTQEGIEYFYYAYADDESRKTPIQYAYLLNSDHNPFNTNVEQKGMFEYEDAVYIDGEKQREFLEGYSTDFLDVYNKDANFDEVFLNADEDKYGSAFISAYYFSERNGQKVIRPSSKIQDIKANELELSYTETSSIPGQDSVGAFNPPGTYNGLSLYRMAWDEKKGDVTITIPIGFFDFYSYKGLNFLMALDSADSRNQEDRETAIDITLVDYNGNEETIRVSSKTERALQFISGKLEQQEDGSQKYNHYTPLGSYVLSFDSLNELNEIDGIEKIKFTPVSNTGSIMLGGIDFYQ